MRRQLKALGCACAVAVAAPAFASAAEPEPAAASDPPVMTQSEEITVVETLPYVPTSSSIVTKLPVERDRTPANVGVVGDLLIAEQGAVTLGDALVNVSGVSVEAGAGVFDFFVLRGFDSLSSGLVLTDGAPEPEVTFYPLFNVERVEVFKGPAGFLHGSNPLAGAVNLVHRQPEPGRFGRLAVEGGSFGTFAGELDGNLANADGSLAFRLNAYHRTSDGYREGKEGELTAINPAVSWRPSDRSSLTLNAELGEADFEPDAGLPLIGGELPPVSRDASYDYRRNRSAQDVRRLQADYQTQLTSALALRNKAYYRALDWSTDGTLLLGAFPYNAVGDYAVVRSLLLLDDDQELLGNQLELTYSGRTGGLEHRLVAGLEISRADDRFTLDFASLPLVDLRTQSPLIDDPVIFFPLAAGDSRTRVLAPYVIDHVALSDRWQALVGVRFDDIDFEDDVTRTRRSDGEWSPMLGLTFAPSPANSLYASAAQSFAPPSPRVVGERRPERSRQLEVGGHQSWRGGKVRATASLYQLKRENIAIPDDNGFTQQAGDQRSRGVELELAAQPRPGLAVVASYAYTDSELTRFTELVQLGPPTFAVLVFDRSGNRSAFAPEHLARAWVSQRFGRGLRLGAGLRYVGERFTAEDNFVELDDVLLFDAGAGYDFGAWGLSLDLDNLTDEQYETRAFGSSSVIPAAPFAAKLRLERRF